jgi:hypothetical protein
MEAARLLLERAAVTGEHLGRAVVDIASADWKPGRVQWGARRADGCIGTTVFGAELRATATEFLDPGDVLVMRVSQMPTHQNRYSLWGDWTEPRAGDGADA